MSNNSLRNILNDNIENHKQEIKQISRGILLSKVDLNQPQKVERWNSIKKLRNSEPKKGKNNLKVEVFRDETFNSKMLMFAVGPDPLLNKETSASHTAKPIRLRVMDKKCDVINFVTDATSKSASFHSEPLAPINRSPERYNFTSPRYLRRNQISTELEVESCSNDLVPHYIHPRFKTQYDQLLRFRNENVREDDEREQQLLTGTNLVNHLESRLQKKLETLDKTGRGPNFVRLQVFSETLNDLISESWMFAPLLIRIKSAYDDEVDRLLQIPVAQRELLTSEVEQLKNSIYNKQKLENLQSEVVQLDEAITICLESEVTYSNLLSDEQKKLDELITEKAKFDEDRKKRYKPMPITVVPTESEKLELLKVQCWDLMDEISTIQKETRQKMVSRATIAHLSEGLQDIGIEVEKLNYHKSQLKTETDDMRRELYEYINEEEIREDDFRLIESLLNAPSPLSFTDYEESNKWNWYIS